MINAVLVDVESGVKAAGHLYGLRELLRFEEKHLESCEARSAILDSVRNILVLTADNRTYELAVG
jgi:hypothetical protein